MFMAIATLGIPEQWNRTHITPVHKKGTREDAANYHPVSVMGALAKLFAACLNWALEREAQSKGWQAPMQAGFITQLCRPALSPSSCLGVLHVDIALAFNSLYDAQSAAPLPKWRRSIMLR